MQTEVAETRVEIQTVSGQPGRIYYPNSHIRDKGPPPTYEEAIDPNAPPPTYDSLFVREVREVRKLSSGFINLLRNGICILIGTIGCSVVILITFVIPITMIVLGLLYLHDCPNSEYVPIFLLIGGGFGVLKQLLHLSARVRMREEEREEERVRQSPTQTVISCFMLGWFIIGSMWVFGASKPDFDDPTSKRYCNRVLYTFALLLVSSVYITFSAVIVCLCSASAIAFLYGSRV